MKSNENKVCRQILNTEKKNVRLEENCAKTFVIWGEHEEEIVHGLKADELSQQNKHFFRTVADENFQFSFLRKKFMRKFGKN